MSNNHHGHENEHENNHHHDPGHGHGNGDGDTDTLPTPMAFTLYPKNQAIITVAFYGPLEKQISIIDQTGFCRIYDSCMDGRRPYIVINNTSTTQTMLYTITPSVYANVCEQPTGSALDLMLKGYANATGTGIPVRTFFGYYVPSNQTMFPGDQVGITIVVQTDIGDLLP